MSAATEQLEQRSDAWREARVGCVTASGVGDLVKQNKNGSWSAKRANYLDAVVAERMTGKPQDWKEVWSLTQRAELEPEARACYTFYTGNECQVVGFVQHPTIEMAGASPDGLIGDDGMLEIKCLDPKNHLKLFEGDESIVQEYMPQMVFGMACTKRHWCDFESYCPTMKDEELRSYIHRVPRNEKAILDLEKSVKDFLAEVDAKVERIKAAMMGRSPLELTLAKSINHLEKSHVV